MIDITLHHITSNQNFLNFLNQKSENWEFEFLISKFLNIYDRERERELKNTCKCWIALREVELAMGCFLAAASPLGLVEVDEAEDVEDDEEWAEDDDDEKKKLFAFRMRLFISPASLLLLLLRLKLAKLNGA